MNLQNLPLSRKYITKRFSDEDLFRYYFGDFEINRMYSSPFRKDDTPSFNIFYTPGGELLYKDFGQTKVVGDVISFIGKMYGLSYRDSLLKIYSDLVLNKPSNQAKVTEKAYKPFKKPAEIDVVKINYNSKSLMYWEDHKVTLPTLDRYFTTSLERASMKKGNQDDYELMFISQNNYHSYCFYEPVTDKYKIYRPFNSKKKKQRFISNYNYDSLFGLQQLPESGEYLFWTKACKDVLIFAEMGFNAICPSSESCLLEGINQDIIKDLRRRFKKIIVCYDNDEPGIQGANLFIPYFDYCVFVPKESLCKDLGEFSFRNYKEDTKKLINTWLEQADQMIS